MFTEFNKKLNAMAAVLRDGYAGKHERVAALIAEARELLIRSNGKLGPWEAELLQFANDSINCNFLMLALNEIGKALDVSKLSKAEYDFGFNYAKPKQ